MAILEWYGFGSATTCTNGSIAGIQEMNTFMDGWVCDALTNGMNYFCFEAFDGRGLGGSLEIHGC